jgi:hypothetical protein
VSTPVAAVFSSGCTRCEQCGQLRRRLAALHREPEQRPEETIRRSATNSPQNPNHIAPTTPQVPPRPRPTTPAFLARSCGCQTFARAIGLVPAFRMSIGAPCEYAQSGATVAGD